MIDTFYKLGMCIYNRDGVVCPSKLCDGMLTTTTVDNIDHNPSSTSSHDSFHGTAISLVQHPTTENPGTDRATDVFDPSKSSVSKKFASLPSYYSEGPLLTILSLDIVVPNTSARLVSTTDCDATSNDSDREEEWLDNNRQVLNERELTKEDIVSWAVYRASKSSLSSHFSALISLLPMFTENVHSLAMIAHAINVIGSTVKHLKPSQIPFVAVDQPLLALAKQIQRSVGGAYDESHVVIMLGGLHIEKADFKALGKWVLGSGWPKALTNAHQV